MNAQMWAMQVLVVLGRLSIRATLRARSDAGGARTLILVMMPHAEGVALVIGGPKVQLRCHNPWVP